MKKNKISLIIQLTALFLLFSVTSYTQEILSLEQCREMALENNKQISISGKNKEKAEITSRAYLTNYLPKFSASGMGYYSSSKTDMSIKIGEIQLFDPNAIGGMPPSLEPVINELAVVNIPDLNLNLKTNNTYLAGVSVEQPIYAGGKITAAYKMSKIGTEIAELNQELTRSEIITETDRAFWLCIQATELQKSAQKYKETVEEFFRVVKNASEAGMKSKNDMMKVQVQLNQAELQLRRAENAVKLSKMNLCYITGMPVQYDFILQQTFNNQLMDIIENDADITSRPEYSMLSRQIDLKKHEKRLVQSDFMPKLGVRASYNYMYGLKLNNERLFNDGSFSAIASLNIPLFHWGEGAKKIKAAETDKIIMQLQRDEASEKMTLELEKALHSYNEALLEVELTKTALSQSEENLKMSRDHYEAGMESISDYLEAQAIWQNAESEYIIAQTKLEISKTEYLKAAGKL